MTASSQPTAPQDINLEDFETKYLLWALAKSLRFYPVDFLGNCTYLY